VRGWLPTRLALAVVLGVAVYPMPARAEDTPQTNREAAKREAATFGMIALALRDPPDPHHASRWWERTDLGPHEMRMPHFGESPGGLALSGVGLGAGGSGQGSKHEGVGTVGEGKGVDADAVDHGRGRLDEAHANALAKAMAAGSHLSSETIFRIVRQSYGAMNLCYERGLRFAPTLHGRIAVKYTIEQNGTVSLAADRDSDLPDPDIVACVVRGFLNLSFPSSSSGRVTVVYPIEFRPDAEGGVGVP
jgi:hypothetical protein